MHAKLPISIWTPLTSVMIQISDRQNMKHTFIRSKEIDLNRIMLQR
jgi:hypothetical protein